MSPFFSHPPFRTGAPRSDPGPTRSAVLVSFSSFGYGSSTHANAAYFPRVGSRLLFFRWGNQVQRARVRSQYVHDHSQFAATRRLTHSCSLPLIHRAPRRYPTQLVPVDPECHRCSHSSCVSIPTSSAAIDAFCPYLLKFPLSTLTWSCVT